MRYEAASAQRHGLKISIAMATYNGERFLEEQLASLAAQKRLPDELVVSDDASTDRTLELLYKFRDAAPFPVRIHRNERNLGFSDNFLQAARMCSGDWIAYCDQDDVWLPEKLMVLESYTSSPDRDILLVAHNAHVVDESLTPSGVRYHNLARTVTYRGHELPHVWVASGFTMMFRADLISRIPYESRGPDPGIVNANLGHDVWISRLARILGDVVVLPDCLALYRRHGLTTSGFLTGGNREVRNSRRLYHRVQHLAARGAVTHRGHARAAACQAAAFGHLGRELEAVQWRDRFLRAEVEYAALSQWLLMRSHVYGERRLHHRLRYLMKVLTCRGYFRFNGHSLLNSSKIMRDILFDFIIAIYGPK